MKAALRALRLHLPEAPLNARGARRSASRYALTGPVFEAATYRGTFLPFAEARSLPGHVYHDPDWHAAELRRLLQPSWVLAGRVDELKRPGSYMTLSLPGAGSAIIVKGKDGQVRAWANVCPHRGATLLKSESGHLKAGIVCPYHAWTFDGTSGALRSVTKPDCMPPCFNKEDWPLQALRLETYRGFLFVTASDSAPALQASLGNIDVALGDWPLEDFVTVGRAEYHVECNWKFLMQNTSETYHTSYVHRTSLGPMASEPIAKFLGVEPCGSWDAVHVPGDRSVVPMPGEPAPFPELRTRACTYFVSLFPTLQLNVTRDCAWWMRVLPTSATTSCVTQGFLFPASTAEMPSFRDLLQPYLRRWDIAVREDNDISLNQQKACQSPQHRPGPYHGLEFAVHRFDKMVVEAVLGETVSCESRGDGQQPLASSPSSSRSFGTARASLMAQGTERTSQGSRRASSSRAGSPALSTGDTVCVTGATGFIALHLVEQLLRAGFGVTATVRSRSEVKLAPLWDLAALGPLKIIPGCDLLTPGSFDEAVADASVCFHMASPFWMDDRITDPLSQLVAPAEQGTVNVLDSCSKAGVRRVVLTSSFAAVMNVGGRIPWAPDFHYSEEHWNVSSEPDGDGAFPEPANAHAYRWSKTVAERAAWAHPGTAAGTFDVVTILPPMVLGENKQILSSPQDLNQSSLILYNLLAGNMKHVPPGSVGFVDVADVAKAHLLAAQTPGAGGHRYLCSGETRTWLEITEILRALYPSAPLPTTCADGSTTQPCLLLRNDKIVADLGMEFAPLTRTLQAQCSALVRAGLLQL